MRNSIELKSIADFVDILQGYNKLKYTFIYDFKVYCLFYILTSIDQ